MEITSAAPETGEEVFTPTHPPEHPTDHPDGDSMAGPEAAPPVVPPISPPSMRRRRSPNSPAAPRTRLDAAYRAKMVALSQDLVGVREIADRIIEAGYGNYDDVNRARSQVTTWIARRDMTSDDRTYRRGNGFPAPLIKLAATGIYLWSEVQPWIDDYYGRTDDVDNR